ncbi:MAG: 23S rRNA (adenine(2503)-C(2))-methyltransferase RlmN [Anaerolineales bacterium]
MTATNRPNIYDLDRAELASWMASHDQPSYRADQLWHWLYVELAAEPSEITTLPLELRTELDKAFRFRSLTQEKSLHSSDGQTEKFLLGLPDEDRYIEAVLMRYHERRTACISTQAGCAMGCVFCATGQMGLQRNLSAGEIIEQVLILERQLRAEGDHMTNIVVMGMGEPLHNYDATMEALDRLNDSDGFKFGARRITLSTVGLVPAIRRFTEEGRRYNLAVSLHATTDDVRSAMLPINSRYPLDELFEACHQYIEGSGRRLTFEWALVRDVNDGLDEAHRLADRLDGMLCHVNLIPLNPTAGYAGEPTPQDRAEAFQQVLTARGIPCTIRVRRGIDIQAGCGQLATEATATVHPQNQT